MASGRRARKAAKKARKRKSTKTAVGNKRKSKKKVVGRRRKAKKKSARDKRKVVKKAAQRKRTAKKKSAHKKRKSIKKAARKKRETVKKVSGKKRKTAKISSKAAKKTATKLSDNADFNTTTCNTVPTPAKQIKKGNTEQNKQSDPADDFFRQNRVGEIVYDCKAAALSRLASIEKKFPFLKVVNEFEVPEPVLMCSKFRDACNCISFGLSIWGSYPSPDEVFQRKLYARKPGRVCPYNWDPSESNDVEWRGDSFEWSDDSTPPFVCLWSTHDAVCNYVRRAWINTLHEGIYLSDASGINEFLNRNDVARLFDVPEYDCRYDGYRRMPEYDFRSTSFVFVHDDTFRGQPSDGDDPLTRCARISGDPVVGEVLLKEWAKQQKGLDSQFFCTDKYDNTVFHVCARKRRKEFARLAVKYLGHELIYRKNFYQFRLGENKTPVDCGFLRLVPDDTMFESFPSVVVPSADAGSRKMIRDQSRFEESLSRCAKKNLCRFCVCRLDFKQRCKMLGKIDRSLVHYNRFIDMVHLMLNKVTQPERELLRHIVMNRPRNFFYDDQQAELMIAIGRASPQYGPENKRSRDENKVYKMLIQLVQIPCKDKRDFEWSRDF